MADNINMYDDDTNCVPLPINETRLKEITAMEEAEQRLIEDIFSTPLNAFVNVKAPINTKHSNQKKPILLNKKTITISKSAK